MIKLGQIMDKETKGLQILITYEDLVIKMIPIEGLHTVLCEILEVNDAGTPINYIESKELPLDLNNLNGRSIREYLENLVPVSNFN